MFKRGLIDPWNALSSWSDQEDCCRWAGVRCDNKTGRVRKLHVGYYDLSGEISPKLLELEHLNYLDLSYSNFNCTHIPSFLGSMGRLRHLNLGSARFCGLIPHQLGNLSGLHYLDLSNSDLYVDNLHWMSNLSSMKYLDMSTVNLNRAGSEILLQPLPAQVLTAQSSMAATACSSLSLRALRAWRRIRQRIEKLVLLDWEDEVFFTKLSKLKYLSMSQTSLFFNVNSNWVPPFQLEYADMSSCKIGPNFPSWLQTQRSLQVLLMSKSGILGTAPGWFWNWTSKVDSIDLSSNHIEGDVSDIVVNSTVLNLRYNHLKGRIPYSMGFLVALKALRLHNNSIFGDIPLSLTKCSNLGLIDIGRIPSSTQLQSFDALSYTGNPELCGAPLKTNCTKEQESDGATPVGKAEDDSETSWFYIGLGAGFAVGFWGVCAAPCFKKTWRHAYLLFLNNMKDQPM
uniref:Uncharacterized protein n=1 Tax=Fagus sylvatica TaxID=28930 RepID=A0A2N9GSN0_FAGSY